MYYKNITVVFVADALYQPLEIYALVAITKIYNLTKGYIYMYNDYKVTNTRNGLYKYIFDFEYTPEQLEAITLFYSKHSFFTIEPMED